VVTAVEDGEILEAKAVIDAAGVGCGRPVPRAWRERDNRSARIIRPDERVVAVLTGHLLKDPGILLDYHQRSDPPPPGANRPLRSRPTFVKWRRW
jgi:threonine synthase